MCFQCVVDLLWKCFQCVGFGFKLSNAQIFCRKANVVEKQENWLETLSFVLFFTEYLQKGNWVQKKLNAGFSMLCHDCYDIFWSHLKIPRADMDYLWNLLPPKKNVTSCRGIFQTPAKTHENCDLQDFRNAFTKWPIYLPSYLSIYTSLHTYIHPSIHTYIHLYIHTYTHTHTYIRTYVRTYIHTLPQHIMKTYVQKWSLQNSWHIYMCIRFLSFPVVLNVV
jgi:hypothetical protein